MARILVPVAFDRLVTGSSSIRAASHSNDTPRYMSRKSGAMVIPNGFVDPPPSSGGSCRQARMSGAQIIPNGFVDPPPSSGGSCRQAQRSGAMVVPNGIIRTPLPPDYKRIAVPVAACNPGR